MTADVPLTGGGRTRVHRRGDVVVRDAGPWTPTVHTLLRHLERAGFPAAPRVVGTGFDPTGRETLTYVAGDVAATGPWSTEALVELGRMLRALHDATAGYRPPPGAVWFPWHGRDLGGPHRVVGHRDTAPWNVVARAGRPVALIDWEFAGPVDPVVELAQACWLNVRLHDDAVAELEGLPPLAERARQLRAMVDAYGLARRDRAALVDRMVELVVSETAWEADDAGIGPTSTSHPRALWAMAWRARAAAWLQRHRRTLRAALS
jgi:Ser/Thr protein kinase RdoA (MazF antagonist)